MASDSISDFLDAIQGIQGEPVETLKQSESPLQAFLELASYLGSSPRLLDAVLVANLLIGDPDGLIMALGAHLLISAGGTAPRSLRGTSSKGASKPLQKASEKAASVLKNILGKRTGLNPKDISANSVTGGMAGCLVRLLDEGLYNNITPACRSAISIKDLSADITEAEKVIETWTVAKLMKPDLTESLKSGLLTKDGGSYKLNWDHHGKKEERKIAISEQASLKEDGGAVVLAGRGSENWLKPQKGPIFCPENPIPLN